MGINFKFDFAPHLCALVLSGKFPNRLHIQPPLPFFLLQSRLPSYRRKHRFDSVETPQ